MREDNAVTSMGIYRKMKVFDIEFPKSLAWHHFFLIYINDLPFILDNARATLSMNDTSIYQLSKSVDLINSAINDDFSFFKFCSECQKLSSPYSLAVGQKSRIFPTMMALAISN